MALRMSSKKSTPLSFDLQQDLFGKLKEIQRQTGCLLYTSPSPRDGLLSRMPSSA